jgi:hypothetical protein
MNNVTKILLGGAALGALATAPAMAAGSHPSLSITALHVGKTVNKTKVHSPSAQHLTYTFAVYTYVSPADAGTSVHLYGTFYKWNSNLTLCSNPKQKIKSKTAPTNGTSTTATETYSFGCASGPTVFRGDTYNYNGDGATSDYLTSLLKGKFYNSSVKYKGKLTIEAFITL